MPAVTGGLFLIQDPEEVSKTGQLADRDLRALHTVADWIKNFVTRPNKDLGRAGPVCPFVQGALERNALWLAPEHLAEGGVPQVVELMNGYKRRLLEAKPTDGDVNYNVIVVVCTDLSADRAQDVFDGVLQQLAVPSYAEDGLLFGAVLRRQ